jgi:hypothetical protein
MSGRMERHLPEFKDRGYRRERSTPVLVEGDMTSENEKKHDEHYFRTFCRKHSLLIDSRPAEKANHYWHVLKSTCFYDQIYLTDAYVTQKYFMCNFFSPLFCADYNHGAERSIISIVSRSISEKH